MENLVNLNLNLPATSVPNGTAVINPVVAGFVERYRGFLRATAESLLGISRTLIEAEAKLDLVEFSMFLDEIGLQKDSSTYRKLKSIGESFSKLNPFVERLPNAWTTLYKLSRMEPGDFARVSSRLTPFITAKEIDELLGPSRKKNPANTDLSLDVAALDTVQKSELYEEVKKLKERFGFTLSAKDSLINEIKTLKQRKAA